MRHESGVVLSMCGGSVEMRCGTNGLADARNRAVVEFLARGKEDWLFWVDPGVSLASDTLDRLLEVAEPVARPIVSALYFIQSEQKLDGGHGWRILDAPTIFDRAQASDEDSFAVRWDYPRNAVTRASGTGMACVLFHRSVLETIAEKFGPDWFSPLPNASAAQLPTADLSFCIRAAKLDIPIHVHTGVAAIDPKQPRLVEEEYWRQRTLHMPSLKPESARRVRSGPLRFAAIPTHNRPARLHALVVALGTQCDTIIVLDNASTPPIQVGTLQGLVPGDVTVEVIRDDEQPPNLSRLWNVMFDRVLELAAGHAEWDVAVFNDDTILPARWYETVATALREHPTAAAAATDMYDLQERTLVWTEPDVDPTSRMCPFAFVVRGERGLRADERMHWYWFDVDFDWQARLSGGVISIPGLRAVNAHRGSSTVGALADQAVRDREMFARKWGRNPW